MKLLMEREVNDRELLEAIALRCSRVFPALNIANSLGGEETIPWLLVRSFSLVDLVREARSRNLDLTELRCAVEGGLVTTTDIFKRADKQAEMTKEKE